MRPSQQDAITAAVRRAPSVHGSRPWRLEFDASAVTVVERADVVLREHDPEGRDRLISCGAALANARLAVRGLGRAAVVEPFPDHFRRDAVGRVRVGDPRPATDAELARLRAIPLRHSYRHPFTPPLLDHATVRDLLRVPVPAGVGLVHLAGPAVLDPLAALLCVAGRLVRGDLAYQRELDAWREPVAGGRGYRPAPRTDRELPWAGLVDRNTAVPPQSVLAERLAAETLVLVTTVGDGRSDHLAAGVAVQDLWLACVACGLAASVLTQPLHVVDVRAGLIERLELPGYPQVLVRIGHPVRDQRAIGTHQRPFAERARGGDRGA